MSNNQNLSNSYDKYLDKEENRFSLYQNLVEKIVFDSKNLEDYCGNDTHLLVVLAKPSGSRRGEGGGEGDESGVISLRIGCVNLSTQYLNFS